MPVYKKCNKVKHLDTKLLTQDKIAVIFQTTFENAFTWMKMFEFRLKFYWNLSLMSNLQYPNIGSANGFAPARRQTTVWANVG